jgi:hypothetical protein
MKRKLITAALLTATFDAAHAQIPQLGCDVSGLIAASRAKSAAEQAERDAQCRAVAERERRAAEDAERQRQEQAWAAEQAKRRQAQEAAAREQARIAAMPSTRLLNDYRFYAHVKWCDDLREGYLVQYINDAELERARQPIGDIVEQTTKDDPSIDTDDNWQQSIAAAPCLERFAASRVEWRQFAEAVSMTRPEALPVRQ